MRLGFLPRNLKLERPIWIHAVSVGEVIAVKCLVEELKKLHPRKKIVISTVTPTGNKIAQGLAAEGDFVTYLPLDISFIVRSLINRIKPSIFIIAETEIWPNLISCLYKRNIPVIIVNGRISDASFAGYSWIKFLISPVLRKVNLFCMQTERDKERLVQLGVRRDKIQISGNMKFDVLPAFREAGISQNNYADKYRSLLGLKKEDKLWVAGSTHHQEEGIILKAYINLLKEFPNLKLLIAPRHPERSRHMDKILSRYGFWSVLISTLPAQPSDTAAKAVFVLDGVGQLLSFYTAADLVFVGGSLVEKGGHNILEPASVGKPILFGPYIFNFQEVVKLFLSNKAAILVNNQEELEAKIIYLLNNRSLANEMGQRARQLIIASQGATRKNLEFIEAFYRE